MEASDIDVELLAVAMASLDGKRDIFLRCKNNCIVENDFGHYEGYTSDAKSLIEQYAQEVATYESK